ncbi:MAG: radical SAM protein, partial [Armatimonadota bacterium]
DAEFADRFLVEIGRGCGRSCSFCLARQVYKPLRWRSPEKVLAAVRRGLQWTNDFGLVAAAVSDYPGLDDLCRDLGALSPGLRVSTSSVRMETASLPFLQLLANGGQRTVTFAPEAATERLRREIGKNLPEHELFDAIERAMQAGLSRVRLYFMVGLPTETDDDRAEIAALAARLTQAFPATHFRLNAGAFSPRPHTPFEKLPLPPLRELRNWLSQVQRSLRGLPRVEVATDSARWAAMQAALSRSDARLGLALARHRPRAFTDLVSALAAEGLDFEQLIAAQDDSTRLPWKVVNPACAD